MKNTKVYWLFLLPSLLGVLLFYAIPFLFSLYYALVVLLFADNWNIVDQAVVFIKDTFDNPLSVYLGNVVAGDPGMFFAVSVFYLIPALLVFLLGQDYLTEGIALSSVKS